MPLIAITAPASSMRSGAAVLARSIERGDWDNDTSDFMATAASALRCATGLSEGPDDLVTARIQDWVADEVDAVLNCDPAATTTLAPLIDALTDAPATVR